MSATPWKLQEPFRLAWMDGALTLEEASLLEDWEMADEEPPPSLSEAVERMWLWAVEPDSPQQ